ARWVNCADASLNEGKRLSGEAPPPGFRSLCRQREWYNVARLVNAKSRRLELPIQLNKRSRYLICVHNEPLFVATVSVNNPDCSPPVIYGCDPAQTPTAFLEIREDYCDTFDFP